MLCRPCLCRAEVGVPIYKGSQLVKRGLAEPLTKAFMKETGFVVSESGRGRHSYDGYEVGQRLYKRWPAYAIFGSRTRPGEREVRENHCDTKSHL